MRQVKLGDREFRHALGCFATGVTVISALGPRGEFLGNTVNSFTSVSLDPPMILWCMGRHALSLKSYLSIDQFVVNILGAHQIELSNRFAKAGGDKWEGVPHEFWDSGCPVLKGVSAAFECKTSHTHVGGDHVIFVGEVQKAAFDPLVAPLVFHGGRYCRITPEPLPESGKTG
ncbi:MAG: flavin reductase family protein [Hyphomicrobiaceae bacterium]